MLSLQLCGTLQQCCMIRHQLWIVQEGVCESQRRLGGGFITATGLPAHVWGQPRSLTRKAQPFPTSSQPNSYQVCCLTHDLASTSALKIKRCGYFPVLWPWRFQILFEHTDMATMVQTIHGKRGRKRILLRFQGSAVAADRTEHPTGSSSHPGSHAAQATVGSGQGWWWVCFL